MQLVRSSSMQLKALAALALLPSHPPLFGSTDLFMIACHSSGSALGVCMDGRQEEKGGW